MVYVKVNGYYPYRHRVAGKVVRQANGTEVRLPDTYRIEVIEPGSVVMMAPEMAASFIAREMGESADGPELLIKPGKDAPDVERPGVDPRPARAEQAVARPQRAAGAV